jgi:predicted O-linked N-acetylglucosamine transferase (SPINDLY family)
MGVPVIMLLGETYASRYGGSVLTHLDLEQTCIARSAGEYIEKATQLANNLDNLERLRDQLRDRVRASPLMDAREFARHVERAYRQMWRSWCQSAT